MADRTIRIGKVSSVDYGSGMIKVVYPDLDNSVKLSSSDKAAMRANIDYQTTTVIKEE